MLLLHHELRPLNESIAFWRDPSITLGRDRLLENGLKAHYGTRHKFSFLSFLFFSFLFFADCLKLGSRRNMVRGIKFSSSRLPSTRHAQASSSSFPAVRLIPPGAASGLSRRTADQQSLFRPQGWFDLILCDCGKRRRRQCT